MKKIDPQNKVCIYLDQFVISDIIIESSQTWTEIKELLESNYRAGKIYCPLSSEHILETLRKKIDDAKNHDNYLKEISDGYVLKNEPFLTAQLISSLIRRNKKTLNTFLIQSNPYNVEEFYDEINFAHNTFRKGIGDSLAQQNELRKVIHNKINNETENEFIETIVKIEVGKVMTRLHTYLTEKSIRIRPDNFAGFQIPNWVDQLLYQLTYKHRFGEKEFKLLLAELETNGFNRIPTLRTRFLLKGYMAVKSKQENSSDHIDIMRISNYLFSSDILFTDKKRKHEICDLGLHEKYNTKVFSGIESDLNDFIYYLKKYLI